MNSNLTKHFLQIIISLETVIEQNPDESMSKLKKDNIWKVNVSISIEEQIVSIINLIYSLNSKQHVSVMTDKDIKNGYNLRSKIIHEGEKLPENTTELLKNWFDLSYLIIYSLMFSKKWDNVYELWKAANLN